MNNPFQEQLLKAGLVTQQQVNQANKAKQKKHKQQRQTKKKFADRRPSPVELAAQKKAERDRELNLKREQQAKLKAISVEIDQMIREHALKRGEKCEIAYNFEHRAKVHRIYIDQDMKHRLVAGQLGIARIEGRYELVPPDIADKIRQRNEKRVIVFDQENEQVDDDYADYKVPDDLMW
jgi:uncharacterized protein YaiL (DUF2058 family)